MQPRLRQVDAVQQLRSHPEQVNRSRFPEAGQEIRAGDAVVPVPASANRDPERFVDADRLDLARTPNAHIAFGHGYHQCRGVSLARVELEIAYRTLFERIPNIRLDLPMTELPFKNNGMLFGLHALPVSW